MDVPVLKHDVVLRNHVGPHEEADNNEAVTTNSPKGIQLLKRCLKEGLLSGTCQFIWHIPRTWPRLFALVAGIVVPLWVLVGISVLCGYFLARLEAGLEIEQNNNILANHAALEYYGLNVTTQIVYQLPSRCFQSYTEANDLTSIAALLKSKHANSTDAALEVIYNDIANHMETCGPFVLPFIEAVYRNISSSAAGSGDLTFNWIRCYNSSENKVNTWFPTQAERDVSTPEAQLEFYRQVWQEQQQRYLRDFLESDNHTSSISERIQYFDLSIRLATGAGVCVPNSSAAAWFWFTVMTTVGTFPSPWILMPRFTDYVNCLSSRFRFLLFRFFLRLR